MPLNERVAWYVAASKFSQAYSPQTGLEHIQMKVRDIQKVRERLSHLKRIYRHG